VTRLITWNMNIAGAGGNADTAWSYVASMIASAPSDDDGEQETTIVSLQNCGALPSNAVAVDSPPASFLNQDDNPKLYYAEFSGGPSVNIWYWKDSGSSGRTLAIVWNDPGVAAGYIYPLQSDDGYPLLGAGVYLSNEENSEAIVEVIRFWSICANPPIIDNYIVSNAETILDTVPSYYQNELDYPETPVPTTDYVLGDWNIEPNNTLSKKADEVYWGGSDTLALPEGWTIQPVANDKPTYTDPQGTTACLDYLIHRSLVYNITTASPPPNLSIAGKRIALFGKDEYFTTQFEHCPVEYSLTAPDE